MDFVSNQEIIMAARRNLSDNVWHYLTGGAESETTMRRNRFGLDSLAFRPRMLVDVSEIDPSTTFLGHKLAIPVMLAPIGSLQSITPEGGVAVAKAAEEFGTVNIVSSVTQPSLEEIAAASHNPKIFQLYVQGDLKWVGNLLTRVKQAGYSALCLTVDTAHYGHRERQMMDRWLPPSRRGVGYEYRAGLTWNTLDAIKEMAGLPFILKGVATAEDAALAVAHGVGRFMSPTMADASLTTGGPPSTCCRKSSLQSAAKRKSCSMAVSFAAATYSRPSPWGHVPWPSANCKAGDSPPPVRPAWCGCSKYSKARSSPPWHCSASSDSINSPPTMWTKFNR